MVGLADARRIAARHRLAIAEGCDPVAERAAQRGSGTFTELADRYLNEHAKKRNKSWEQAAYLARKHLLPRWGKLDAKSISRADVRQLMTSIEAPIVANQALAAASAIFSWAVKMEIVTVNPVQGVERNEVTSRSRILSDTEVPLFWRGFESIEPVRAGALKVIPLLGQRPGEVCSMRVEHIVDGWWQMPGAPTLDWPGTKNARDHRVFLPQAVRDIIASLIGDKASGFVFSTGRRPITNLDATMRDLCSTLGIESKVTPHDLRRSHGSTVTRLGFGRPAMDRVQNHRTSTVTDTYDRYAYAVEDKTIMEAVASHFLTLALGGGDSGKVVRANFR